MKNKLKAIRERCHLTTKEVGQKIGRSAAYVEGIETGKNKLALKTLLQLAGTYKVTTNEIFDLRLKGIDLKKCDDVLLDCCVGFMLEAGDQYKKALNKNIIAKWTPFMYDATVELHLNATQVKSFSQANR
jgi:DNA-binding XRE family transcriptional regulator